MFFTRLIFTIQSTSYGLWPQEIQKNNNINISVALEDSIATTGLKFPPSSDAPPTRLRQHIQYEMHCWGKIILPLSDYLKTIRSTSHPAKQATSSLHYTCFTNWSETKTVWSLVLSKEIKRWRGQFDCRLTETATSTTRFKYRFIPPARTRRSVETLSFNRAANGAVK